MAHTRTNLLLEQGSTFTKTFQLQDSDGVALNTAPYTAAGKMRKHHASANADATFTTAFSGSNLTITIDYVTTANIEIGRYVYDVELTNTTANTVERVVDGIITVTGEATK